MDTSAEIAHIVLNVSDDALFAGSEDAFSKLEWNLAVRNFRGLALRAPKVVEVSQQKTLPVLLATQVGALRDWKTPVGENLSLLVFDHATSSVSVAAPFADNIENRPDTGRQERRPKPQGDAASGVATSVKLVETRELFQLGWKARQLSIAAISFDWVSNEARVTLTGGEPAPVAPKRPVTPPAGANGALPSYDPAAVKAKPTADGVSFSVGFDSPNFCVIRGSLATPDKQSYHQTGETEAVVPVTFVLAGRNWKVPWTFEWGIPVSGGAGGAVTASFAIPLPAEKLSLLPPGEYAAYMVLEGRISGPENFIR